MKHTSTWEWIKMAGLAFICLFIASNMLGYTPHCRGVATWDTMLCKRAWMPTWMPGRYLAIPGY